MKDQFYRYIQQLQDRICHGLEQADGGATFREDIWERPEGGGGQEAEEGTHFLSVGMTYGQV